MFELLTLINQITVSAKQQLMNNYQ